MNAQRDALTGSGFVIGTPDYIAPEQIRAGGVIDHRADTWGEGGKTAQVRVEPGTRKVEVRKDGFPVWGEKVTLQDGDHRALTARLEALSPPEYDLTGRYRSLKCGPESIWVVQWAGKWRGKFDWEEQEFRRVWDLSKDKAVTPPFKHTDAVRHASLSPDGKQVVTLSHRTEEARDRDVASIWDVATGKELKRVTIWPD